MPEAARVNTEDETGQASETTTGERSEEEAIEITESAAERLADEMMATEGEVQGLRLLVQPGDCGMRYGLSFAREGAQERDVCLTSRGIEIHVDQDAFPFVEGATIDFQQTLLGEGFAIENPNEAGGDCGSGCGCR